MSVQEDSKSSKVEIVPEQSYIAGLTNLSLVCPLSKCSELVEFYEKIGFKKASTSPEPQKSSGKGVWLILDLAKAGLSISSKSYIEYNQPSGGKEVFLHLDFSGEASVKPSSSIALSFCVPDLKRFKTYLESAKLPHKLDGDNITVFDPLANKLVFATRLHPFSTGKAKAISNHPRIISPEDDLELPLKHQEPSKPSKRIAVLTSGGDSQGMNCAVRAVVRAAIARNCEAYFIHEGYQGTIIGTARCMDFKTREGRLKGAENLIINGIDALVVIGGDGSLTGADLFRSEWKMLVADLVSQKRITQQQASDNGHLTIVGLVGSIDNDMAGTDFTIGAVSSLHRICESVDNVTSTALSHKRAFVIEVMGRHCGWLALMAAVCTGADFVFIPEQPMDREEWKEKMCTDIKAHRGQGRRATIVIVSEGAIDRDLKPIKSEDVAAVIEAECDLITRVTNLGHVQRGGMPASYDRILGAVQGIQAVDVILTSTPTSDSKLIAIQNNLTLPVGLMEAVQKTKDIASLVAAKQFDEAMQLRDPYFSLLWDAYSHSGFRPASTPNDKRLRIGILHIGAPAGGMNAATRTLARLAINAGHTPVAFHNGIRGLLEGDSSELGWLQVANWTPRGGSEIGTNRELPEVDYGLCAYQLQKHRISCLFIVGGFEAYRGVAQLAEQRANFPAFCMPIAYIPATISNNVPGADYSLGCDTSLNAITEACDRIIQSAASSHSRTFVVEVQGGNSGFLATMGGLSVGASRIYTPEEGLTLKDLEQDVAQMKTKFIADSHRKDSANVGRVVLVSDGTSKTYTTEMISAIFSEEGAPLFDSRTAVLGHIQQGGTTSPVDRIHAVLFAHRAFFWLVEQCESGRQEGSGPAIYTKDPSSAVVIGTTDSKVTSTPVQDLDSNTDWVKRRPRHAWWHKGFVYNRLLSHYAVTHESHP